MPQSIVPPLPLSSSAIDIFIGRARELGHLQDALDHARTGRGQLVLLAGEPGVGKTRLAEHFATRARQHNVAVLWGRCWEGDGAPAFWPWLQVVRSYLPRCTPDMLATDMGSNARAIAHVIAEVRECLPHLAPSPTGESDSARFRFFDSLVTWLKRVATRQPLLLILDDLHWADTSSLLLLQFFARELHDASILVLGTYRDTDVPKAMSLEATPLAEALGTLVRDSQHVCMSGLAREEVAQFMTSTLGAPSSPALVASVYERTEGNPFFISELVQVLAREGHFPSTQATRVRDIALPQSVRATIRHRLTRVSPACRHLLSLAAVIGREFSLALLQEVRTMDEAVPPASFLPLLDEALIASLLEHAQEEMGRYRFIHALVRETLYEDMPQEIRIHLHRHIGEALERCYQVYLRPYLAELAHHFLQAASESGAEKALHYLTQAGERANALLAYEEAAAQYERALHVLPLQERTEEQRCDLLLALGESYAKAGSTQNARATFQQAAAIARKRNSGERLARAALGIGGRGGWGEGGIVDRELVRVLEEALTILPHHASALRARLLARLSTSLYWSLAPNAQEQREAFNNQALAIARRLQDPDTLAAILLSRHVAVWSADNVHERLAIATEIIELAGTVGNQELALWGHVWRYADLLELGDVLGVERESLALEHIAAELRQPLGRWYTTVLQAGRLLMTGHFTEGEMLALQALSIGQDVARADALQMFGGQIYALRREQGRLEELVGVIEQNVALYSALGVYQAVLANCYSELHRFDEARPILFALAGDNFASVKKDAHWHVCCSALAATCAALNERDIAVRLYPRLLPYAEHNVVAHPGLISIGSVKHFLGLLAGTLGEYDVAVRHFAEALAANTRMGMRPFAARTQYEYARVLLTRNGPGDEDSARDLLTHALATATELAMTSIAEKARGLQTQRPTHVTAKTRPTPLAQESRLGQHRFVQEGKYWTIVYQETTMRLPDTKGLHYLSYLLRTPGREAHVFDLLALTDKRPAPSPAVSSRRLTAEQLTEQHGPLAEEMSTRLQPDAHARTAYKQRLADLQVELEEAERFNDPGRTAKAQDEIAFLRGELVTAYGLHTRSRSSSDAVEKVRKAVTNRIRASLTQIHKAHPALWQHLFKAVKTGTFCSYQPVSPTEWRD